MEGLYEAGHRCQKPRCNSFPDRVFQRLSKTAVVLVEVPVPVFGLAALLSRGNSRPAVSQEVFAGCRVLSGPQVLVTGW